MRNATKMLPSAAPLPLRVALYARVSTARQAEADLSIPDQVRQAEAWCQRQGHELVRQYIEPGASGTDETRPVFSEMLSDAKAVPKPFDIILVHSFSRFARDNLAYAIAKRELNKAGVTVQSITQPSTMIPPAKWSKAFSSASMPTPPKRSPSTRRAG
jgi:site-specific DNA recombinase